MFSKISCKLCNQNYMEQLFWFPDFLLYMITLRLGNCLIV